MRDAAIDRTARTPIGRAHKAVFIAFLELTALAAHPIKEVALRSGIDPAQISDVRLGASLQPGHQATFGRSAAKSFLSSITVSAIPPVLPAPR